MSALPLKSGHRPVPERRQLGANSGSAASIQRLLKDFVCAREKGRWDFETKRFRPWKIDRKQEF
jgi:hypothetical protein